jgi:hypothetical protein
MTDDQSNEPEAVDTLISIGTEIAGGVTGAAIGLFAAGPAGALAGGVAGPLVTHAFRKVALEIRQRFLGRREEIRIGATFTFATAKVQYNLTGGKQLRQDDFFQEKMGDRSSADEIVEGTLLAAQREHEERKLRFYGNMVANIAFHPEVSRTQANQLIRQVERMTYQQLCLLALFVRMDKLNTKRGDNPYFVHPAITDPSIAQEMYELFDHGVFQRPDSFPPDVYISSINMPIDVSAFGLKLYELTELHEVDAGELEKLSTTLTAKSAG